MELDVSDFQMEGEWLKLDLETKKKEGRTVTIMVLPMSDKEGLEIASLAGKKDEGGKPDLGPFIDKIKDYIVGWKIKIGGKDLPCNDKNKKEYLKFICGMSLKGEADRVEKQREENAKKAREENKGLKKEDWVEPKKVYPTGVGTAVIEFAQNFDNFIKN